MTLKLYVDLLSQPARAITLFVRQNKIPHELKVVSIAKGEHKTSNYINNVHPFGKVPAINDNGFKLIESIAILRYLARKYDVPDHWYPKDIEKQARVDEFLEWQHLFQRVPLSLYFITMYVKPLMSGKKPDEKRVNILQGKMEEALDEIETVWLKDTPYLVGDQISIADLVGISEIEQPRIINYDVTTGRPKIKAWMQRVQNELQPHYDEVFAFLNKLSAKNKSKL